ncbi:MULTISPECIES: SDR family oxidoreductase [unclassified Rhodococcus (in: high G+C Gram-positive bacteria)]|uniref:SDR family oxidoreductase n=1 Tax=unclassified Rhodococcus (in: high G+C Gram-positive bacteria) TaxID=192944 RepID=UPI000484AEB8|nr:MULTISPECIES: SDR family oxidoreductase [unclassified Rhodococcus (in: high G+C Gram-positive bacteria)]MBY6679368.1 SDR family oxidoreductase [Rhodococcus sp. BP-332]MBY6682500.1 SDR family oxidoreductase [Rhodococcus sp. BP-316]MBY6687386.1 SDR family oxidoreductase [Rhodococcus sp. BP-288]MBY6694191.1 SDR family oxidoreductase [Rhodococcus sp. BP-188]MBY6697900.1 SDR family oxidoreductase [Rhodococcus sp. BP-285]
MRVTDKVAIVTGGGAGIGAALATALVEAGNSVLVADLDGAAADAVAARLGERCIAVGGDVADDAVIAQMIERVEEAFGPLDIYIANAGTTAGMGLDSTDAAWDTALSVNVLAHVRAARVVIPRWIERGTHGYFLSTASAAGLLTQIGSATYSVSKHAAVGFAEWLSVTYGDKGIAVSCLCPMGVNTALLNSGFDSDAEGASVAASAVTGAGTVLEPEDVARIVLEAMETEKFLVLPHPEVLTFYSHKSADYDRWIAGMRRYRTSLETAARPGQDR